jgi:hypothetical protein
MTRGQILTDVKKVDEDTEPLEDLSKGFSDDEAKAKRRYQETLQHSKMLNEVCSSIELSDARFNDIIDRIKITFWSILIMNWILIGLAVVMFGGAIYSALGGRFDITAVLTATGFGSILTVFTFSMNRVQTSLGDQIQVQIAYNGFIKQILNFDEHFQFDFQTKDIKEINQEIRKITLSSMGLIQKYTKIGTASSNAPWLSSFPIKYGKLDIPSEVTEGDSITISGTLKNDGDTPVTLTSIVIAVRPPLGTPSGGPFTYDFTVQLGQTINPGKSITISNSKAIETNWDSKKTNSPIAPEYFDKEWYAFLTCQTEDGNWHDDSNKSSFILRKKKT